MKRFLSLFSKRSSFFFVTVSAIFVVAFFQNCAKVNFASLQTDLSSLSSSLQLYCSFNGAKYDINSSIDTYSVDVAKDQASCNLGKRKSICESPGYWEPAVGSFSTCRVQAGNAPVCTPGERTQCVVNNGRGVRTCDSNSQWAACQPLVCNPGYVLNVNTKTCEIATCTGTQDVVCSRNSTDSVVIAIGSGTCNPATGTSACQDVSCVAPSVATTVAGKKFCALTCTPNSMRSCQDRNGSGVQVCNRDGTAYSSCNITSCDNGFAFDSTGKYCVAQTCAPGSVKSCKTPDGLDGVYRCQSDSRYSIVCEPTSCPAPLVLVQQNGYNVCSLVACSSGQARNSSGVCVSSGGSPSPSASPKASVAASPSPAASSSPSPSASVQASPSPSARPSSSPASTATPLPVPTPNNLSCTIIAGKAVGPGPFNFPYGNSASSVAYNQSCSSDYYSGICDGTTGKAKIDHAPAATSCSVRPKLDCTVNRKTVSAGAFDLAYGFKQKSVPYGSTCVQDNYVGYCDGDTGQVTLTKSAAAEDCVVQQALRCKLASGAEVDGGSFSEPGFTSATVPAGSTCVPDTSTGTCDAATGKVNYIHQANARYCSAGEVKPCTLPTGEKVYTTRFSSSGGGYKSDVVPTGSSCLAATNIDNYVGTCDISTGTITKYDHQPNFLSCRPDPVATCSFSTGNTNLLVGESLAITTNTTNAVTIEISTSAGNAWENRISATNAPLSTVYNLAMPAGAYTLRVRAFNPSGVATNCSGATFDSLPVNWMSAQLSMNPTSFAQNQVSNLSVQSSANVSAVQANCGAGLFNLSTTNGAVSFPAGSFAVSNYTCSIQIVSGNFVRALSNPVNFMVTAPSCPAAAPSEYASCSEVISGANASSTYRKNTVSCTSTSQNWIVTAVSNPDLSSCTCPSGTTMDLAARTCVPNDPCGTVVTTFDVRQAVTRGTRDKRPSMITRRVHNESFCGDNGLDYIPEWQRTVEYVTQNSRFGMCMYPGLPLWYDGGRWRGWNYTSDDGWIFKLEGTYKIVSKPDYSWAPGFETVAQFTGSRGIFFIQAPGENYDINNLYVCKHPPYTGGGGGGGGGGVLDSQMQQL